MKVSFNRYEMLKILCNSIRPYEYVRIEFDGHRLKVHSPWGDYYLNAEGTPGNVSIVNYTLRDMLRNIDTHTVRLTVDDDIILEGISS